MAPTDERTLNARRIRVDVNMATPGAPDWQQIYGVEELQPIDEPRYKDDETFDDDGAPRQTVTGYTWSLELKIKRRVTSGGALNSVHEKLRTAGRARTTAGNEVQIRWYDRDGRAEASTGYVTVTWAPEGGAGEDPDIVTVTLNGQGPVTDITNPLASLVPIVTALSPTTGPAAGGTLVIITGTNFTQGVSGAAGVKFGGTNATGYTVVDDTRIVAISPARPAATYDVTVTGTAGTSSTTGTGDNYTYV